MGTLVLTAGATIVTKSFNNAKALQIIDDFIAENEGPVNGTTQEKADWFLTKVLDDAREAHKRRKLKIKTSEAFEAARAESVGWE